MDGVLEQVGLATRGAGGADCLGLAMRAVAGVGLREVIGEQVAHRAPSESRVCL